VPPPPREDSNFVPRRRGWHGAPGVDLSLIGIFYPPSHYGYALPAYRRQAKGDKKQSSGD